jgi:hypothetical protein
LHALSQNKTRWHDSHDTSIILPLQVAAIDAVPGVQFAVKRVRSQGVVSMVIKVRRVVFSIAGGCR